MFISNILILSLVAFSSSSVAEAAENPSHSPRFISNQEVLTRMETLKEDLTKTYLEVKEENKQMKEILGKLNEVTDELKKSEAEMKEEHVQQQATLKKLEGLLEKHVQQCQITTRSSENVTEEAPRQQASESKTMKATTEMPQQREKGSKKTGPVTETENSSSEEDGKDSNRLGIGNSRSPQSRRHPIRDLLGMTDDSSLGRLSAEQQTILKGSWEYMSRLAERDYEDVLPLLHPELLKAFEETDEKSVINAYQDFFRNKTGYSVDFIHPEKNIFRMPYLFESTSDNKKYAVCMYIENLKVTFSKLSWHKKRKILRKLKTNDGAVLEAAVLTGPDTVELVEPRVLVWLNDERSGYKWNIIFHADYVPRVGDELDASTLAAEHVGNVLMDYASVTKRDDPHFAGPWYTYGALQKMQNQEFA